MKAKLFTSYNGTLLKVSAVSFIDAMQMDEDSTDKMYCVIGYYGTAVRRVNKALIKATDADEAVLMFKSVCKQEWLLNEQYTGFEYQVFAKGESGQIFYN